MRLQLDSTLLGTGATKAGEATQAVPSGGKSADASRIGDAGAGADSIHISGPSSALNRLSADRAVRIQELTAQVQGGTYLVSSPRVSRSIVEHAVAGAV
jgi:hypothetical protein